MDTGDTLTAARGQTPARKRFTVGEVLAMQAAGVLDSGDFELVDGDLWVVSAKKNDHELIKRGLVRFLARALPDSIALAVESTLFLDAENAPEPDVMLHADALKPEDVRGGDVQLLIEIADDSLAKDLGRKAALYAAAGVQTYWVIEAVSRRTHVHSGPLPDGAWRSVTIHEADAALRAPGVAQDMVLSKL